ncbi:MAG TPA: MarR family transcriptional regulator [Haliangiales bacterium]|nr:MarR family transcriptional regulator [Haliangiales bacterium]
MDVERAAAAVAELFPLIYLRLHRRWPKGAFRPTPEAMAVLLHLEGSGPLTVTEAARHMRRSQSTMSALIDRLERRSLIERMADERDRRRMLVWLTPAGQDVLAEERRVLDRGLLARAIAAMADGDRRKLIDGMRALVAAAGPRKETSQ